MDYCYRWASIDGKRMLAFVRLPSLDVELRRGEQAKMDVKSDGNGTHLLKSPYRHVWGGVVS